MGLCALPEIAFISKFDHNDLLSLMQIQLHILCEVSCIRKEQINKSKAFNSKNENDLVFQNRHQENENLLIIRNKMKWLTMFGSSFCYACACDIKNSKN